MKSSARFCRASAGFAALFALACNGADGDNDGLSAGNSASAGSGTGAVMTGVDDETSGSSGGAGASVGSSSGADGPTTSSGATTGGATDSGSSTDGGDDSTEGSSSSGGIVDDGVFDVTIIAHDDCTITTMPASISVPEGTEFTVNWINSAASAIEVDVAKIDQFNQVPIILGMEPGTSYHDEVRVWCGALFAGTFDFRITSCFDPQYLPVDCSA